MLILSYPRSGTSWVGKVLSTSANTAYLREPISQQYLTRYGGRYALVDIERDASALSIYRRLGDEAFRGSPPRHPGVVEHLRDFAHPGRHRKHVLIKEVNPRATKFYCQRYRPKVLLLLRHPAAIALSFAQLGWLESADVQGPVDDPTTSAWARFGQTYGMVMHDAIETLKGHGDYDVTLYDRVAEDPRHGFSRLFRVLGFDPPRGFDDVLQTYCYSTRRVVDKWQLERTSAQMIAKWRRELTPRQIAELRAGYLRSPLGYYRDAAEWQPADGGSRG